MENLRESIDREYESINREYVDKKLKEVYLKTCRFYELDLEKINSIDDCKKILKFLCSLTL